MNDADLMPLLLLLCFSIAFVVGLAGVVLFIRRPTEQSRDAKEHSIEISTVSDMYIHIPRPQSWLAIKSTNFHKVQSALKLHNPRPCPLAEGFSGEVNLFITPPLRGWILVMGSGLPDPAEDVDACFKFLAGLSRKLGEVQFFCANSVVQHHGWIRVVRGKVERAFCWAGATLWRQGKPTAAESTAGVTCPDYFSDHLSSDLSRDFAAQNVDKVPSIAAKWSIDPGSLEPKLLETCNGLAGE